MNMPHTNAIRRITGLLLLWLLAVGGTFAQSVLEINSPTTWSNDQEFTQSVAVSAPLTITADIEIAFQYADLTGDNNGDLAFIIREGGELIIEPGNSVLFTRAGFTPGVPERHWRGVIIEASDIEFKGDITIKYASYGLEVRGDNNEIYNVAVDSTMAVRIESTATGTLLKYVSISNVIAGDAALNINGSNTTIDYLSMSTVAEWGIDINSTVNPVLLSNAEISDAQIAIENRGYLVAQNVRINGSDSVGFINKGTFGGENFTIENGAQEGFQARDASVTLLTASVIADNDSAGVDILSNTAAVVINGSHILDNDLPELDSLYVNSESNGSITADLSGNWWGRSTNINRFIDEVTPGSVNFSGWVTAPIVGVGFTPLASVSKSISIQNIADSDVLVADQEYVLSWTTTGQIPYVDVDVQGITGEPLDVLELPNTGRYTITIPDGEFTGAAGDGSIAVTENGGATTDLVDNLSTTSGVAINNPLGGEVFFGLDTVTVRWIAPAEWTQVSVQYNPDVATNPNSYSTQATLSASVGEYEWIVPNQSTGANAAIPSAQGRLRLVNTGDPTNGPDSTTLFTVVPRPDIRSGQLWEPSTSSNSMTVTINDVDLLGDTDANGLVDDNENLLTDANEVVWVGAFFVNADGQRQLAGYGVIDTDGGTDGVQNDFSADDKTVVADGGTAEALTLTLFGDDPGTAGLQEGPEAGDALQFYLWRTAWDAADNGSRLDANTYLLNELDAAGTEVAGITFSGGGSETIEQLLYERPVNTDNFRPDFEAQNIELPSGGGWTMISSYIIPADNTLGYDNTTPSTSILSLPEVEDLSTVTTGFPVTDPDGAGPQSPASYQGVLSGFNGTGSGNGTAGFNNDDDFVMLKNGQGGVYWNLNQGLASSVEVDQLNDTWNYLEGYMINTTALANSTAIRLIGPRAIPEQTRIPLDRGWNLVPYLRNNPLDVQLALSDGTGEIEIVKDEDGNLFWPRFAISTIGQLEPGKAYWMFSNTDTQFRYPSNSFTGKAQQPSVKGSGQPHARKSSVFMILRVEWDHSWEELAPGDEILVRNQEGLLAGSAYLSADFSSVFHLIGKDDFSGEYGLAAEEKLRFTLRKADARGGELLTELPAVQQKNDQPMLFEPFGVKNEILAKEHLPENSLPNRLWLDQNYPNPFNPSTEISFQLPTDGTVRLQVFDITGRVVATLVDGPMSAGTHQVRFEGANLPSGLYLYRIETAVGRQTRRMTLLK